MWRVEAWRSLEQNHNKHNQRQQQQHVKHDSSTCDLWEVEINILRHFSGREMEFESRDFSLLSLFLRRFRVYSLH